VDLDDNLVVDYMGRLEDVQVSLDWVSQRVGVDRIGLPYVNGTRKGHYSQFHNQTTKEIVAEICQQDIEYFG